ncbi:MAG: MoxR family ATPase [Deltaproteobacteria bacterium]|jgi:hypothetical protein|nr:MoxR family ATPase [Deltaproteobacteria bacterium]
MNIKEAKTQIKNAMLAYFSKDEFDCYRIPLEKQRPVLLIGPPGIGKTAVMEQVASELGVGLVSYSMTHHTRQSALGLPVIVRKNFRGYEYDVSEYTMSEIIGSVYEMMDKTGVREGILFLDEINCVSETLAPCMLQFLQYKIFGQHRVPDGWIVVTAGNPPEYNKSVRDFDVVTWDRLKKIEVVPDYPAWREYASEKGVHPSVTTYLAARRKDFYLVENTVEGRKFVTARGWDDLSEIIKLYEENGLPVDESLVEQYLQHPRVAKNFAIYYDLYQKYHSDYQIDKIMAGDPPESIILRARMASFDERVSLLGLLYDAANAEMTQVAETEETLLIWKKELGDILADMTGGDGAFQALLPQKNAELQDRLDRGARSSSVSPKKRARIRRVMKTIDDCRRRLVQESVPDAGVPDKLRGYYREEIAALERAVVGARQKLDHVFAFYEKAVPEADDILLLVTELTAGYYSARFIGHYGCESYFRHNADVLFDEREKNILSQISQLCLAG